MRATIGLEHIGALDDRSTAHTPTICEVYRDSIGVIRHRPLRGRRDFARANRRGSRGIYRWYILEQGKLYWVREQRGWTESISYYVTATNGEALRLDDGAADEWLRNLSASMC